MFRLNQLDGVYWVDNSEQIAKDTDYVQKETKKAIAYDACDTVYVSDGTDWINMNTSVKIAYFILTLTIGANTSLTVVDSEGNVYTSGDRVLSGATLTISAFADTGYDLTTYTVGGVDKTGDNPTSHTMSANVAVVTAATEA